MRLFLDLQALQGESSHRGIGRYSFEFARAVAHNAGDHEVWLGFTDRLPMPWERVAEICGDQIPPDRVVSFAVNGPSREVEPANRARASTAEKIREAFIADVQPDVVHIASLFEGFGHDIATSIGAFEPALRTTVTLYDLIPLLRQDAYFHSDEIRRWYMRKIDWLGRAHGLLAISESAKQEAVEHLHIREDRISVVYPGINPYFRPVAVDAAERSRLRLTYGLEKPFVLHTAGADSRKNVTGLIEAFALLPSEVRNARQLAIVTTTDPAERRHLLTMSDRLGLTPGQVVLTGFVPDEDLRLLYNSCEVFAYPSLHEGFGLPAAEAMACGATVIASNASSIPEVVGRPDALFDPLNVRSIAQKLLEVLATPEFAQDLRRSGAIQVTRFTWEKSAEIAWKTFEKTATQAATASSARGRPSTGKPKLAFFSPLPPKHSGIADYSAELLPELAQHYEIQAIVDDTNVSDEWIAAHVPLRTVEWFGENATSFDRVLYNMGNSEFHEYMLPLISRWPGVVVLHDFFLSGLFTYIGWKRDPGYWTQRLYNGHGLEAVRRFPRLEDSEAAARLFPCSLPIIDNATGVIVHSDHAVEKVRELTGGRAGGSVRKVPFPRRATQANDRIEARARLGIGNTELVICSFGHIASPKLNHRLVDAWEMSGIRRRQSARLVFVGDLPANSYATQLWAQIRRSGQIEITGHAELARYKDYLAACDFAVQLRADSRGETSASVFDCLAHGTPVIINAHGSMAELPEEVALKIADAFSDEDLVRALNELADDAERRAILARRGSEFARRESSPEGVAEQMRDAIEGFAHTSNGRLVRLVDEVGNSEGLGEPDILAAARAIGSNRRSLRPRQLLLDVSELASGRREGSADAVVASLIEQITRMPSAERAELVRIERELRYARSFAARHFGLPPFGDDRVVELLEGDRFLALDMAAEPTGDLFDHLRRKRVGIHVMVRDMLALTNPKSLPASVVETFGKWIAAVGLGADVVLCPSRSIADDLLVWLEERRPPRTSPLRIGVFSLGSEFGEEVPGEPRPTDAGPGIVPWPDSAKALLEAMEPENAYRVWRA